MSIGAAHTVQFFQPRRAVFGQAVRLDPRPERLAGRDDLLAELHSRLAESTGIATVALAGLGGVGKTTAVLEYAHRHRDEYDVLWQFHAEDGTGMLAQFHDLARMLDVEDFGDPVTAVHTALAAHPGRWLLVLDNAPDYGSARRWMPPKGDGHVLVTTRDGHWPARQVLVVSSLPVEAGTRFLMDSVGSTDASSAHAVSAELGGLPLALAQAAAYCQATGRSLEDYLRLLQVNHSEVLARAAPATHAVPVMATWSLAIAQLEMLSPASVVVLRIAAYLAPDDIPIRLILHPATQLPEERAGQDIVEQVRSLCSSDLALDDAVAALRRHSLIGPPGETFSIHRLVQAVTRSQLLRGEQAAWKDMARVLVEAAVPQETGARETWAVCSLLLPHAQLLASPLGLPMRQLAEFLGASGDFASACAQWRIVSDADAAHFGPDHLVTLASRGMLALWTARAGHVVEARDLFADLLTVRERVLGSQHPATLATRGDLAYMTGMAGDAVAARDLYKALLPIQEEVLGPEHSSTLAVRGNLADWTGHAGDVVAARDQYQVLLPIRERVLGPEHPLTLTTRANLAHLTGEAGDAAAARDQYGELVQVRERVLGLEHPDTLTARANLARRTGEAGDAVAARDQYAALLPIRERVLGPEHPDMLTARANFANWTGNAGDAAAARDLYEALVPIRERVSGPQHPHTFAARAGLAYWTRMAGMK